MPAKACLLEHGAPRFTADDGQAIWTSGATPPVDVKPRRASAQCGLTSSSPCRPFMSYRCAKMSLLSYRRVKTSRLWYPACMVIENPFVTRDDLREALDPSGGSPSTAIRRLREAGLISHGIDLRLHQGGRLRGGTVYYCALNLDAAEAVRDGDETA